MLDRASFRAGESPVPGYRLCQRRGKGGFAEVWEARTDRGEPAALKFVPCGEGVSIAEEIRALQSVREMHHPNLIRIDQIWSHKGFIIVAMELADASLADMLDLFRDDYGTAVDPTFLLQYMRQSAEAIDYLNLRQHRISGKTVGIQHCDIKPSNLLLVDDTVKVSDFGLAAQLGYLEKPHRRAGTLWYTAPEVFQGRLTQWTDQYSLAVSYCELRGGRLPFGQNPSRFERGYVRPEPDLSMMPKEERPVVARGLAHVPQNRWPTCTAMIEALLPLVAV